MQGLCTLDLCGTCCLKVLPDSIGEAKSLKSLLLENCRELEKVPYLGKLKALRELNLSITAIKEVPRGVEELLNLELLSIDAHYLTALPSGWLSKLVHLQHLRSSRHLEVPMDVVQNLRLLEEFHGGVGCVEDFNNFIRSRESRQELDTWYTIVVIGRIFRGCNREVSSYKALTLSGCNRAVSSYKKALTLSGCNLENQRVLGQETECLWISECEGLSISFLNYFPGLKKLNTGICGGIEWILRSDGQGSHISTLEEIQLRYLDDLKGMAVTEREEMSIGSASTIAPTELLVFSSIKSLSIYKCKKMRKVGLPVSRVPNLENIEIQRCEEMEEVFEDEGRDSVVKLKGLKLSNLPKLRKVGLAVAGVPNLGSIIIESCGELEEIFNEGARKAASVVTTTLPNLTYLYLLELPRLKRVSKGTIISDSIETILIIICPELMNKLPLHFNDPTTPPSLREIIVDREWWESLEWDTHINPNLPRLLLPFVAFENQHVSIGTKARLGSNMIYKDSDSCS